MTVIEVLVALTLLAGVFASVTMVMSRTVAGLGVATDRDGAQQLAVATLEEAKAYGCGLATGADAPAVMSRWQQRCWGGLGDATFTSSVGTTTYTTVLHTAWKQLGAGPEGCIDANASRDRDKTILAEADGLERLVTVQWKTGIVSATGYESVPPDAVAYRDISRGAVLVRGAPGTAVAVSETGPAISRVIDASGCALFPFLLPGQATWSAGTSSGTVAVAAEQIVVEPGGVVIS